MKHGGVFILTGGSHQIDPRQEFIARHHSVEILAGNVHKPWQSGSRRHENAFEAHGVEVVVA